MRSAFKEWAVIVDALGHGRQILILRKGGIREGKEGFQVEHPEFLLFPTLYHQQRENVLPDAQARFDEVSGTWPGPEVVRIEYHARIEAWCRIGSMDTVRRLRGLHVWRDDVIADRFHWGRDENIFAMALRVHRLAERFDLPMVPDYAGCKSWIELARDIPTEGSRPVLDDASFASALEDFQERLSSTDLMAPTRT